MQYKRATYIRELQQTDLNWKVVYSTQLSVIAPKGRRRRGDIVVCTSTKGITVTIFSQLTDYYFYKL